MSVEDLPLVGRVREWGADDSVFDALLVGGPLVVAVVALFGRSPITAAIVAGYLAVFVVHVLSNWYR